MTKEQAIANLAAFMTDYAAALRQLGQPSAGMLVLENAKQCLDVLRPVPVAASNAQDHG